MALIGNMIATSRAGDPSIVNYSMFVAVFSMLSLFYLIPASMGVFDPVPMAMVALDVLNALFYFCGAVALAAYLGVHSCGNSVRLQTPKRPALTNGSAGLHAQQPSHQRLSQHGEALP